MSSSIKQKVPQTLRNAIWKKRFGRSNTGICVCCTATDVDQSTFECGHILSKKNGGRIHKENLEPICSSCNKSMGTHHMFEFMKEYGFCPHSEQKELCDLFDDYFKKDLHEKKKPGERHEGKKPNVGQDARHEEKKQDAQPFYKKPEIETCVKNILGKFRKGDREVQVIAPTQSGKSDVLINLVDRITSCRRMYRTEYNFDKVVIIICAADNDLKRDLSNKFKFYLPDINTMIVHLPDIMNYTKNPRNKIGHGLEDKKDCSLIIFDENHCDLAERAIVDNFRNLMGIGWGSGRWINGEVRVLGLSATPYEHICAGIPYVEMKPNEQYYSIEKMMANNLVKQSYDLTIYDNVSKLFEYNKLYSKKGYVIIRLQPRSKTTVTDHINKFMKNKMIIYKTIMYDMKEEEDINVSVLCIQPNILVIIYVKDKIRKGKTLLKEYILMMHDRKETTYTSTTVQGLLGRGTGFNANRQMVIYCDLKHITSHLKWVEEQYNNEYIPNSQYLQGDVLNGTTLKYIDVN